MAELFSFRRNRVKSIDTIERVIRDRGAREGAAGGSRMVLPIDLRFGPSRVVG